MGMTEKMFNALMTYLEVYDEEEKAEYREHFECEEMLCLYIMANGEIGIKWE